MSTLKVLLAGDVMTGRGVDQVLPSPVSPDIFERYVSSAVDYVALAEQAHGPIPRLADPPYIWGDGLAALQRVEPDVRIVNLETCITRNGEAWPKGINYRMSPENAACLSVAGIDCCVLANNHVLDWGQTGLTDTLGVLAELGIKTAGAGRNIEAARAPAIVGREGRARVVVFAATTPSSGTPASWAANAVGAGVHLLPDLSDGTVDWLAAHIRSVVSTNDIVVFSVHWGGNWGYDVTRDEQRFARGLIERAGVSIVHGHSSHHPKAIEVHQDRLILYGCGDLLNDYEGISGREGFRSDLALMFFASVDGSTGTLVDLEMVPFRILRFQLVRASRSDATWLCQVLDRESRKFGTRIAPARGGVLKVSAGRKSGWQPSSRS